MVDVVVYVQVMLILVFFFSSRRRHTRFDCDWSSDVCSSDLAQGFVDENHIGRLANREDLPRGGDTDEQLTAGGEEFLGHQRREGSVDHAPNKIGRASCRERG